MQITFVFFFFHTRNQFLNSYLSLTCGSFLKFVTNYRWPQIPLLNIDKFTRKANIDAFLASSKSKILEINKQKLHYCDKYSKNLWFFRVMRDNFQITARLIRYAKAFIFSTWSGRFIAGVRWIREIKIMNRVWRATRLNLPPPDIGAEGFFCLFLDYQCQFVVVVVVVGNQRENFTLFFVKIW